MRAFFILAAVAINRQRSFRTIVAGHLVMLLILLAFSGTASSGVLTTLRGLIANS